MCITFRIKDLVVGGVKAFTFAGIISFISCYEGFITRGGAIGVGFSAMRAVVFSAVLILASDFIISLYFYG